MNTRFDYLYRDASNYKFWGDVILTGPFTPEQYARLRAAMESTEFFIAHDVGLPELFPWVTGEYTYNAEDDHSYHTVYDDCLVATEDVATDPRTVEQLVAAFEQVGADGWQCFDPAERKRSTRR